MYEQKRCQIRT